MIILTGADLLTMTIPTPGADLLTMTILTREDLLTMVMLTRCRSTYYDHTHLQAPIDLLSMGIPGAALLTMREHAR